MCASACAQRIRFCLSVSPSVCESLSPPPQETPVFDPKAGVSELFPNFPKTGFFQLKNRVFDPKTGNYF